jgi:sugar/nucleoside kinase (ribokinase family)
LESKGQGDPDVLVAGHVVMDEVIDYANQAVPRKSLGGPVAYSSIALTSLGFTSEIVTNVGDDFPSQYSALLRSRGGVQIDRFKVRNEKTTSFRIDRSIEPRRMWLLAKCKDLSSSDFFNSEAESRIGRAKGLVVNTVAGEISLSLLDRISKEFEHVFVDSQGFVRKFSRDHAVELRSGLDISALSGVDFLKADHNELSSWTGLNDFEGSLRQIARFVRYIIITSGPGYAEIYEGEKVRWRARPLEVEIRDTTGAGDIFLAVFAAAFGKSEKVGDALASACSAAALALGKTGIEKAVLDKEKLDAETARVQVLAY